jgi:protein-disulfide isomerase
MMRLGFATIVLATSLPSLTAARADDAPCAELAKVVDLRDSPSDDRRVFCAFARDTVAGGCCRSSLYDCLTQKAGCARGKVLAEVGRAVIASGGSEEKAVAAATAYEDNLAHGTREKIDLSGVPCKGPPKGPTLVEFSDFDCPHCALAAPIIEKLAKAHPDLRVCSMAFPLPMHKYSRLAAATALYADSKGKYWQMSSALFAHQSEREEASEADYRAQLLKTGASLGLDAKGMNAAMEPGRFLDRVDAQAAQAHALKLDGTPYFFLDGRNLKDIPLGSLGAAVEDQEGGGSN